ncbi:MAG: hypothetical protein PHR68_03295 [Candidatus Gracilibacteria bacterium]|nr:hypothetical protein [Candidatus Gracilibacteria bacterium]
MDSLNELGKEIKHPLWINPLLNPVIANIKGGINGVLSEEYLTYLNKMHLKSIKPAPESLINKDTLEKHLSNLDKMGFCK